MAVDMFMKFDDTKIKIEGESQDAKHTKEVDVLSWSWGMSNSGSAHMGSGAGAGKVNVQDLTFTKYVDKATPKLMLACCQGNHLAEVTLAVRKAGSKPLEYLKIRMFGVLITSFATGGTGTDDRLTEKVTLNFGRVLVDYVPQKPDGSGDTAIPMSWDIAANTSK